MKILHLSHRLPYPPDKGDRIRSYHQLRYLSERHDVWCACFVDTPAEVSHVDTLRKTCREVAAIPLQPPWALARGAVRLATGGALSDGYYADRRMRRVLRGWSQSVGFDAAVVFSSGMATYHDVIRAKTKVLDFCDWDSLKWRAYADRRRGPVRWAYALEARRLGACERRWFETYDACTVVTEAERDALGDNSLRRRIHVVGNGVDVDDREGSPTDCVTNRVGFVGQMDYWPNVDAVRWFADEVWPSVRREVPDATFDIVGRSPSPEVSALAERDGICVTGEVPDVRSHLDGFAVSVAPLRIGRGIQNKVLEAMAASRPVVLTTAAASGIDGTAGTHFVVADDPRRMTRDLVSLLKTPQRRAAIGTAAHAHVARHHSWSSELAKLESLLFGGVVPQADGVFSAPRP